MSALIKRIAVNTLSGYFRLFTSFAVLFILTPYIIGKIGKDGYGLWSLTFSILGFFELLDFGFAVAVIKYVAECNAKKDVPRRNQVISTVLFIYLLLACIGMVGIGLLVLLFGKIFSIPSEEGLLAIKLLFILSCRSILLNLPFSVFRGILFGEQKIYLTNLIGLVGTLSFGFLAWLALSQGFGILGLGLANLLAGLIENGAYLLFCFILTPDLKISLSHISRDEFNKMFSFSSAQLISNVSSLMTHNADLIIIKLFMPLESVGIYAIPLRIVTYGYMLIKQFTNVLTPVITDMHTLADRERLKSLFLYATKYAFTAAAAIALPGMIFAKDALTLWVGASFGHAEDVLIILLLAMWLASLQFISSDILQMSGYHALFAKFVLLTISIHLLISFVLIKPLGLFGVALGVLAGSVAGFFTYLRKVLNIYEINIFEFLEVSLFRSFVPLVLFSSILIAFKLSFTIDSLWFLAFICATATTCYFAFVWFFALNDSEKENIKSFRRKAKE